MSDDRPGPEEGPHGWVNGREIPPEQVGALLAALENAGGTHIPTTLDYRLKALEITVMAGHHGTLRIKSVQDLIKSARKLETFLRENS